LGRFSTAGNLKDSLSLPSKKEKSENLITQLATCVPLRYGRRKR
jgi:hypothetical protein